MKKKNLKWFVLGGAAILLYQVYQRQQAAGLINPINQSYAPIQNSEFQFNDYQVRWNSPQGDYVDPLSLINGSMPTSLQWYEDLGDTRRTGYDMFTSPAGTTAIV